MNISKRHRNLILKVAIFLIVASAIYIQVIRSENLNDGWTVLKESLNKQTRPLLFLCILLMPINWGIETLKWRLLIFRIKKLSFIKAFRGVLMGVTLSVFTPNRIGEYGGRVLVLEPKERIQGVVSTLVGSLARLTVAIVLGVLSLLEFVFRFKDYSLMSNVGLVVLGLGLIFGLCFLFFNLPKAIKLFPKKGFLAKIAKYIEFVNGYSKNQLAKVFFLAFCRYQVFVWQYYLLLKLFGVQLNPMDGLMAISLIFFIQTIWPFKFAIAELVTRYGIALAVFKYFLDLDLEELKIGILYASTLLWFINLILPAALGSLGFIGTNYYKVPKR